MSFLSLILGDITQKGYEKKRAKLLAPYLPQTQGRCLLQLPSEFCIALTLRGSVEWLWSGALRFHLPTLNYCFICVSLAL